MIQCDANSLTFLFLIGRNHDILASRARLNRTFVTRTDLGKVPVDCILKYMNQANRSIFEERIKSDILSSSTLDVLEALNATNLTDTNSPTTPNETDTTQDSGPFDFMFANATNNASDIIASNIINLIVETEDEILLYMTQCQKEQNDEIQTYLEVRDDYGNTGADSLSFNWVRCWPEKIDTIWGDTQFVFFPSRSLIQASHPSQQEAFVENEFARILEDEETKCLESGGDSNECFEQALEEASAATGDVCHANVEGTSWFFFTIMTTVGKSTFLVIQHTFCILVSPFVLPLIRVRKPGSNYRRRPPCYIPWRNYIFNLIRFGAGFLRLHHIGNL